MLRKSSLFIFSCCVAVLPASLCAQTFALANKVVYPTRLAGYQTGYNVAISGNYSAVYNRYDDVDVNGQNPHIASGSVSIYKKDGNGNWTFLEKLVHSDRDLFDQYDGHAFGSGLAMDDSTLAIGANREPRDVNNQNNMTVAGAVYVYKRSNGNWIFQQKLVPSDRAIGDVFGNYVSVSGKYLIASSYKDDEDVNNANFKDMAGSAYIFEKDANGNWVEKQKITAPVRNTSDQFGSSVGISSEGYAVVGAPYQDYDANEDNSLTNAGAAYVFERDQNGTWNMIKKIVSTDREYDGKFGLTVAINKKSILVGAQVEDVKNQQNVLIQNCGAAYLFVADSGKVSAATKITAPDLEEGDSFGASVAISSDIIAIGAHGQKEDFNGQNTISTAGAVYIFKNDGNGNYSFFQQLNSSNRTTFDLFGIRSAVSESDIIVGVYNDDYDENGANLLTDAGAAFIFKFDPQTSIPTVHNNDFRIFPNPANDIVSISGIAVQNIILYNSIGEEILQSPASSFSTQSLPSGMYFISLQSAEGRSTHTLMIQK